MGKGVRGGIYPPPLCYRGGDFGKFFCSPGYPFSDFFVHRPTGKPAKTGQNPKNFLASLRSATNSKILAVFWPQTGQKSGFPVLKPTIRIARTGKSSTGVPNLEKFVSKNAIKIEIRGTPKVPAPPLRGFLPMYGLNSKPWGGALC